MTMYPTGRPDVVTKASRRSVADTVDRFTDLLAAQDLTCFAVIDQAAAAASIGLDLRETVLVLFGSPAAGTPIMASSPLAALDLPLKVVIWADRGTTRISYLAPDELSARYGIAPDLTEALHGIDALTDALVAS